MQFSRNIQRKPQHNEGLQASFIRYIQWSIFCLVTHLALKFLPLMQHETRLTYLQELAKLSAYNLFIKFSLLLLFLVHHLKLYVSYLSDAWSMLPPPPRIIHDLLRLKKFCWTVQIMTLVINLPRVLCYFLRLRPSCSPFDLTYCPLGYKKPVTIT
jgi:hypothetical protein